MTVINSLVANDLYVDYVVKKGSISALKGVSFHVKRGELLVILGPSGCGKTTLLKTIAGLLPIRKGSMELDGIDATTLAVKDRNLAYVSQSFTTYRFYTVYRNIATPLKAARVPLDEIDRRVHEAAKKLEIEYLLSRKPSELSRGQQQKVAIAKALVKHPSIYLFDEPFSNLDFKTKMALREEIKRIHHDEDATMVFVTHDLNDALALADRVLVMEEGKIVKEGEAREIVFSLQDEVGLHPLEEGKE